MPFRDSFGKSKKNFSEQHPVSFHVEQFHTRHIRSHQLTTFFFKTTIVKRSSKKFANHGGPKISNFTLNMK